MIKSKKRFDTIIILTFVIFILSFVAIGIVKDSIIELLKIFSWNEMFNALIWSVFYLMILRFFYINNTKIIVHKRLIEFKSFMNNRKYKPEDIDYYLIAYDYARFEKYEAFYLVKNERIVERVSSFDYANYESLKNVFDFKDRKEIRINLIQKISIILGFKIKVE